MREGEGGDWRGAGGGEGGEGGEGQKKKEMVTFSPKDQFSMGKMEGRRLLGVDLGKCIAPICLLAKN